MALSNEVQAFILALSTFFIVIGTYTAAIPDVVPSDIRVAISIVFWFMGIIGFALKEALGGSPPPDVVTTSDLKDLRGYVQQVDTTLGELQLKVDELEKANPQTEPPPASQPEQNPT